MCDFAAIWNQIDYTRYIKFGTSHLPHLPRKHSTSKFEHVATHLSFEHLGPLKQPEIMSACTARSRLQEHDTSDHRSAIQNVSPQTIADPNKGCSYEVGRLCVKSRGDTPCQRQANRREQARAILGVAREGRGVKNVWADCGLREGRT